MKPKLEKDTINRKIPDKGNFEDYTNGKVQQTFLRTIDWYKAYTQDSIDDLDKINDVILDTYDVNGAEINPTLLTQVLDLLRAKSTPLKTQVENTFVDPSINYNVSKALYQELEDSGFVKMMTKGQSGFLKTYAFGDFFALMDVKKNGMPLFKSGSVRNIYFDEHSTSIDGEDGEGATKCVIILEYGYDEAVSLFPEIEKNVAPGRLPKIENLNNEFKITDEQEQYREARLVEIAYCFDISIKERPVYSLLAGSNAYELEHREGKAYGHYFGKWGSKNCELYFPILQFICKPYGPGMLNKGFGHLLLKYSKILAKMQSKFVMHTDRNFLPTVNYNVPMGQLQSVQEQLEYADTQRADGEQPFIITEYSQNGNGASPVKVDTIQTGQMSADYERLKQDINAEVRRYGLNVDLYYTEQGKTATAISIEEANVNLAIQALQEVNTDTYKKAIKYVMDLIAKKGNKNDETPYTFKPQVVDDNGEFEDLKDEKGELIPFTRGDLVELLRQYEFEVKVDSRTGAINSPMLQNKMRAQAINSLAPFAQVNPQVQQEVLRLIGEQTEDLGFRVALNTQAQQAPGEEPQQLPQNLQVPSGMEETNQI